MPQEYKRRQCFPLRLASSLRTQANDLAHREGISLNHFISLAVAEKISRMEHDLWVQQQQQNPPKRDLARDLSVVPRTMPSFNK